MERKTHAVGPGGFVPSNRFLEQQAREDKWRANKPKYPGYKSVLQDDQTLQDQFLLDPRGDVQFQGDLDTLQERAYGEGPSNWANLMLDRNSIEEQQKMDRASKVADSTASNAWGQLAMSGGASAGARERLFQNAAEDAMFGKQSARRESELDRYSILGQDEEQKMDWAKLFGQEAGRKQKLDMDNRSYATDVQNKNISRALNQKAAQEEASLKKYTEQMQAWASERQAQATENAGGGCFITTAVCETLGLPDDCEELTILRKFRDEYMKPNHPGDVKEYYRVAPGIVEKINSDVNRVKVYRKVLADYIWPAIDMIEAENLTGAYLKYRGMVNQLRGKYEVS